MDSLKTCRALEYDKLKKVAAAYCVLAEGKRKMEELMPSGTYEDAVLLLDKTDEAYKMLFLHGVAGIEFYDEPGDVFSRAAKGVTLSPGELLRVARFLKSGRVLYSSVAAVPEGVAPLLQNEASGIYTDLYLEQEIFSKILSEDAIADDASEKLSQIRRTIKRLNEQIREKLSSFIRSGNNDFLQDAIVTMRGDRYVIPVKSEYKSRVGGFVHDQSASGSTVFIEPTAVLELNNDLRTATLDERTEIERILADLSQKVGTLADKMRFNEEILVDFDLTYARAIYAYRTRSNRPVLTGNGVTDIRNGRHPLIDPKKVVPVSLRFGKDFRFLLVTGPNTGGKTVTLKMTGLFSYMAMSGFFLPASEGTQVSFYDRVFCDVGDEQSIEQSLSTFSSHMKNIVEITEQADKRTLVLIDEIGAGTDPDEGAALAQAIISYLLERGCSGIVTTHYSALKEFAYTTPEIENASMEFDRDTFAPLYRINIGMPGTSNAIEISRMLGLKPELAERAVSLLGDQKISFENVLKEAEKTRRDAEKIREELAEEKRTEDEKLKEIEKEKDKLEKEKEKFYSGAKAESRRLVNEKLEEADEIIDEIKVLFDKAELDSGDLIRARTLRNKLEDKKYSLEDADVSVTNYKPADPSALKEGDKVYYKPMDAVCAFSSYNPKKKECAVYMGTAKLNVPAGDLFFVAKNAAKPKTTVALKREIGAAPKLEVNVIGKTVPEALPEVEAFLDQAVLSNLEEVKIIHGRGMKILSTAIHDMLRRDKRVESFRFGKYGEGEHGVTFVKLK